MAESTLPGPDGSPRTPAPDRPPPPPGHWPLASSEHAVPGVVSRSLRKGGIGAFSGAAGVGLSFAAIAVYLGGQLLLQLSIGFGLVATGLIGPEMLDPEGGGPLLLALVVASQTSGLLLTIAFLRWRGVALRPLVGVTRPLARLIGQGTGIGLAAIAASTLIVSLLVALTGSDATPDQVLTGGIADTPLQLLLAIVAAVILAPLAEELLFRGLLHRGLRRRLALVPATTISSVLFAIVHIDVAISQPLALVGLTVVGVILALAYERTGSLVVPIVIHAVHNAVTIVAVVVSSRFDLDLVAPAGGILRAVL